MQNVTVRTKNPYYDGSMLGYKFHRGEADNVSLKDAEYMAKQFGVEFDKPAKPKEVKKQPSKKKPTKSTDKKDD